MNRRTLIGAAAASAALPLLHRVAGAQTPPKTRNVVFVHGLFADGSCWSKVIARLQPKGVNCTSVQNPPDVAAGGVGGRAAGDRRAAGPHGARRPLLLRHDRV